jgi:outer membrane protein TolC
VRIGDKVDDVTFPAAPATPPYALGLSQLDARVSATYQVDLWGQLDVQRQVIRDAAEIQGESAEAVIHNTAVQVAQLWFEILAQRALKDLLESQVRHNEQLLGIVNGRFELHLTNRLAVLQQEQQLLNTRAQLPLIVARLELLGSQLRALLGRAPDSIMELVPTDRRLPELPVPPAMGQPVDLVENSPEVRMAQTRVVEADHRVSQNLSGWLPVVSLFLNGGVQAFDVANVFGVWALGARLTWPIFDGGQRITEANQLALTVRRRNMLYEQAFLEAIRRVHDAQVQEGQQADNLKTLRAEVDLGRRVLAEATSLYEGGVSDYLPVLNALGNLSDLEHAAVLAQRQLLSYRIELYRALGGTWSRSVREIND